MRILAWPLTASGGKLATREGIEAAHQILSMWLLTIPGEIPHAYNYGAGLDYNLHHLATFPEEAAAQLESKALADHPWLDEAQVHVVEVREGGINEVRLLMRFRVGDQWGMTGVAEGGNE